MGSAGASQYVSGTRTLPIDSVEIACCKPDHTALLATLSWNGLPHAAASMSPTYRWKLSELEKPAVRHAYAAAVESNLHSDRQQPSTPHPPSDPQARLDIMHSTFILALNAAVLATVGQARVRQGKTTGWMTPHVKNPKRKRTSSHIAYTQNP